MGLLNLCKEYFGTDNLYEVLKTNETATEKEVKKAYYNLSMIVHPDRVSIDEKLQATEKFKIICQIYTILSDKNKKAIYDETGRVDDDSVDTDTDNWMDYWRNLFPVITIQDIANYEQKYKGSEEELIDLKNAYLRGKGCFDHIVGAVPFMCCEDEPRITEIIKKLIIDGELPEYKIFTEEPTAKRNRRHNKYKREQILSAHIQKKKSVGSNGNPTTDLVSLIQSRNRDRSENFLDGLAEKYASKIKPKTKGNGRARKSAGISKKRSDIKLLE